MLRSRGFRKFRRSKLAMAASVIILLYLIIALAVWVASIGS